MVQGDSCFASFQISVQNIRRSCVSRLLMASQRSSRKHVGRAEDLDADDQFLLAGEIAVRPLQFRPHLRRPDLAENLLLGEHAG
jgi:hypothetical protein